MAELETKLKAIQRRLFVFRFLEWLSRTVLVAAVLAVGHLLAVRIFGAPGESLLVTAALLATAVVVALAVTVLRRVSLREAALAADESLGLRERLSSALLLKGFRDPNGVVEALQSDAMAHARAIQVSRDFRFRAPRLARHLVWPVAVFVAAYLFLPQVDLFAKARTDQPGAAAEEGPMTERMRRADANRVRELARETRAALEELPELDANANMADRLERLSDDLALGRRERRAAIAELSRMEEEINLQRDDIERSMQPFKQIKGLQRSQQTRDIQNDLKNNDFSSAAQRMQTMAMQEIQAMDSRATGDLAEEMRRLAEELRDNPDMAKAMRDAAEALEQLADAKAAQERQQQQSQDASGTAQDQQAGAQDQQSAGRQDQQQAGADQQQQQAGAQEQQQASAGDQQQQPGSDSTQGQQQQQQGAQQQQQAGSQPDGQQGEGQSQAASDAMAQANEAMQRAAQAMQQQNELAQQMQKLSELAQNMSGARNEMLDSRNQQQGGQNPSGGQQRESDSPGGRNDRQFPNASPGGDCPGGDCPPGTGNMAADDGSGRWQQGDASVQSLSGDGGGAGQGTGYRPDAGLVDVDFEDELIIGQKNEGEIIAVMEIDAPALEGESTVNFTEILSTRQQVGADTVRQNEIPQGYQGAVRDYFESLRGSSQ